MKKIINSVSVIAVACSLILTSCSRDFTETQFHQSEVAGSITTVEQLQSFLNGTFVKMRSTDYLGCDYRAIAELHTDEAYCTQYSGRNVPFSTYTLTSASADAEETWYAIYQVIGNANIIINTADNLTLSGSANAAAKKEADYIKGQAYAIRAQAFFDLLKLYGQEYSGGNLGVVLPTVYDPNALMGRATVAETRAQIEADFVKSLSLIGTSGSVATKNYLNKYSVEALMSRYFLYKGDYAKVIQYAGDVINSGVYSVVPSGDFAASFVKEAPVNSVFELSVGLNGALGTTSYDYIMNNGGYANIALLPSTLELYDSSDVRSNMIVEDGEYYLSGKFSDLKGASNIKVVRYEEVLLNAAEAEIKAGSAANALKYYNLIRVNRGMDEATSVTLADIKDERVRELAGEGFRYWDLLRWGESIPYYTSAGVRETAKDKKVGDKLLTFPIPQKETNVANTPIVSNPGYDN